MIRKDINENSKIITGNPHFPVMLSEIIKISSPKEGGLFIDCTFGGGGYSKEILKFKKTNVIAIDRDESVVSIGKKFEKKFYKRFKFIKSSSAR